MRAVEPLRQRALGVAEIGDGLVVLGQRLLPARLSHLVDRNVAAHHDEPRRRVARRPVLRPGLQRAQTGVLEGLLRSIEVAEVAQQRADRLGAR